MSYPHSKLEQAPVTTRKPPLENKPSFLLTQNENQFIFEILGRERKTLATAVGHLLIRTPDQKQWQVKDSIGAVCLVRDATKRSYFIQVFSIRAKDMIFQQEIYNQFKYQMSEPSFMTFEGDSLMVGVLFANSTEAQNFRDALDAKLEAKRLRRTERETRKSRVLETQVNNNAPSSTLLNHYASNNNVSINNNPSTPLSTPFHATGPASVNTISTTYTSSTYSATSALPLKKGRKDLKTKLTAMDVGPATDFCHVQHVGWDPTKGFDLNLEDKHLRTFFEKAGVSVNELNDEKTRKFIYNFIEQHGVADLFKQSNTSGPATARTPPVPPSNNSNFNSAPTPPPCRPVPPTSATYTGGNAAGPQLPPLGTTSSAIHSNSLHQYPQHSKRPSMPKPPSQIGLSGVPRPVQQVEWDPTKGFDLNLEDKHLRAFFEKAGVSANELNDEKTRKFIYNFIEKHGVLDLFKQPNNF